MRCKRLSFGALALAIAACVAGLAMAVQATSTALVRAETARQHLSETMSAGLSAEQQTAPSGSAPGRAS